ncbi:hypothetical protein Tco_0210779 [Tanacetum coccineum]
MIDSQRDDMIKQKITLKEQVDSLEKNLSKQIKEKECLLQTFTVFKSESKEKEDKYMENEIDLEKKIKELIIFFLNHSQLEKHCISLECSIQLNQEIFQKRESCDNQNALEIPEFFENNDLKAHLQDKDNTICKLKDIIKSLREKSKEENVNYDYCEIETKNVELENSVVKLLSKNERPCNEINHVKQVFKEQFDSIKKTRVHSKEQSDSLIDKLNLKSTENEDLKAQIQDKEQADILRGIVEQAKAKQPLDKELYFALRKRLLSHPKTMPKKLGLLNLSHPQATLNRSKPTSSKRNDRISQTPSRNMKNKVEAKPRKVNKKNYVVETIHDVDVKHSLLNANSVCATLGLKWKPTGRPFTIVGNSCLLTRIISANVVPPKKTTSHSVETQKPELKVYSRKPKNVKNVGSSKKAKIVESKNANHSEPNHTWESNATDIPLSSSLVMTVRFKNDHIARIMGYDDYQLGNVTISGVYYVKGLGHNLFSVGQFCDRNLEVVF